MSYTKQNFTDGQTLTAAMLNKIESGIVQNENELAKKQPKGDYAKTTDLENYQPKGDYAKTTDLEGYQPKGDYAKTTDLENYQPKGDYAKTTDLENYQAKGDYAKTTDLENYQPKGDYLTEHQPIKTINGQSLVGEGNLNIEGGTVIAPSVDYEFKADVYMIPCYGQSLAINTSAGTSTFNYTEPLAYDVNLKNANVQDMCAGTVEAFRIMADYYGITIPENFKVVVCKDGAGGKSVTQLSKGTSYYTSLINHIKTAKASCDAAGLTMIVPCFTWTQGEEDMRCGGTASNYGYGNWNPHTYKDRLKTLIENLNTDIKAITGQTEDVLCISYQLTAHTSYSRYPRIAFQLQELAEEYDKMVMAKVMYDLDYVTEGTSQVHAYARSYRNMGNLYGVAAFNACVLNKRKRWCYPIDYTIHGNKVTIRFDTPFVPLVLDTKLINQLPDGNFGFNIYNVVEVGGNSGSSITEAETKITNVQLRGDDTIELYLSRTPVEGETLTYGVNGDYWQNVNGSKTILADGEGEDGYSKSGWQYGARGCLRDSQPFKNNYSGATFHDLYNWCVLFEIPFTADNLGGGGSTDNGDDSGTTEPTETFTFTVNPTPSDAIVVLNGTEAKSVTVASGTTVEWTVSAEGYATQSGSQVMDEDVSIDITLNALQKYTVTINTVPEDALAIIEDDEIKSVELYEGTVVDWVVSKEGYVTQTGSFTLTEDTEMTVELVALGDMDADAYTYLTTANITDEEQSSKINTLVTSLKAEGLWDKIDALYPMVGSTFEQMSYNLKDPATYQLSTSGTPTIVENTSMACSKQIVSAIPTTDYGTDFHIMGNSLTKVSETSNGLLVPGPSNSNGYDRNGVMILVSGTYINMRTSKSDNWKTTVAVDGDGLLIGSLSSGIVYNGADMGAVKTGTPSVTFYRSTDNAFQYNCYNSTTTTGKVESAFTTGIAGFGKGLTIEEMQKYSEILNAFKGIYTPSGSCTFTVNPTPSDATVTINGTEQTSITVDSGSTVTWEVSKDGYEVQNGTQVVNEDTTLSVELVELSQYTFTISPTPAEATVKINSVEQTSITVDSGSTVTWEVSKDGYEVQTGTQIVNEDTTLSVELVELPQYTFTISPTPAEATVKINSVEQTSITVYDGTTVEWEVSADGYHKQTGTQIVTENETKSVVLIEEGNIDTDAQAYLTAANITDETQMSKVNTMVTSLKAEGLWNKIDALYPMIGSTFEQMSYNLKDPTTYQLRTSGTPTIVENTSMACSKQIVSDVPSELPGSDFHIMGSSVTKLSETANNLLAVGPSSGGGFDSTKGGVMLLISGSAVSIRTTTSDRWSVSTTVEGDGLAIASLTSGIVYNGEDLGAAQTGTPSVTKWTTYDSNTFQYNCYNSSATAGKVENPFTTRIAGFGKGLTIEEMQKYSEILNAFKSMYTVA